MVFHYIFQSYFIPPSACRDDPDPREHVPELAQSVKHETRAEGVYDIPPPSARAVAKDIGLKCSCNPTLPCDPPSHLYDSPGNHPTQFAGQQMAPQKDIYDTPRGVPFLGQPLGFGESLHPEEKEGVYDVPPQVTQDTKRLQDVTDGMNRLSFSSTGSTRSNMSTSSTTSKESSFSASPSQDKRLVLDPDTAIERLYLHQHCMETMVTSLMAFICPDWRSYEYMENHINKIHSAVDKVEQSLVDYLHFAKGATTNASFLSDLSLYNKMRRELQRLEDSHQILTQTSHELSNCSWSLNILAVNKPQNKCDNLDRFVMVARALPDDAKQLTTSISTNAEVLFKPVPCSSSPIKTASENIVPTVDWVYHTPQMQALHPGEKSQDHCSSLPPPFSKDQHYPCSSSNGSEKSWMDDYDYVHLQVSFTFKTAFLNQVSSSILFSTLVSQLS